MSNRTVYILGIALVVFLLGDFICSYKYRKYVVTDGKKTVGEVVDIIGNDVVCEYVVEGRQFSIRRSSEKFEGLQEGEHYTIAYDPEDPSNAYALYYLPVIPKDEAGEFSVTQPLTVVQEDEHVAIEFAYKVNNTIYERRQKPLPEVKLDTNNQYIVKYRSLNPKIAYLFLK